jgi:phosphoglycolate phosphatase-like HAD superfamily hydrolase
MTEDELDDEVRQLEVGIAQEGARLAEEGGRGITILPGVEKFLDRLRQGSARWGIVTSGEPIRTETLKPGQA